MKRSIWLNVLLTKLIRSEELADELKINTFTEGAGRLGASKSTTKPLARAVIA
jgi:hypothetical protein